MLHPRPDEANKEKLYEKWDHKNNKGKDGPVPRLLTAAEQIALAVRGAAVGRGKPPPGVSRQHSSGKAGHPSPMPHQGSPDREILDCLNQHFGDEDKKGEEKEILPR